MAKKKKKAAKKKLKGRGGKRKHAGRKPLPVEQRMVVTAFAALPAEIQQYGEAGKARGISRSAWIREKLSEALRDSVDTTE